MFPRDNLYTIRKLRYNHICLWKMVDGKQKYVKCIGVNSPGDIYVTLADLLIKDCYGYPIDYIGKLPRKLRKKFNLASELSWMINREYSEEEIKVCGLYIIEFIEKLWRGKRDKKLSAIYKHGGYV